jgi:hypothetical protein
MDNLCKDIIIKELEKSFTVNEWVNADYFELIFTHKNENYTISVEYIETKKKTNITVYKKDRDNFLKNDRIKSIKFNSTQKNEILQKIIYLKREIIIKELFKK